MRADLGDSRDGKEWCERGRRFKVRIQNLLVEAGAPQEESGLYLVGAVGSRGSCGLGGWVGSGKETEGHSVWE